MNKETYIDGDKTILNTEYYLYLLKKENQNISLQHQLEEKVKVYAKIRDEIYDYLDSNRFCENFENVGNESNVRNYIFEILGRGKNGE